MPSLRDKQIEVEKLALKKAAPDKEPLKVEVRGKKK